MSELLVSAHFALAALWLGCIFTEVIVARALFAAGPDFRVRVSQLRWKVAALVEMPAFLCVLVTGAYTLGAPHAVGTSFQVMLTVGGLTIFLGVFNTWLVYKRLAAARAGRWAVLEKLIYLQQKLGLLVLLGVLTALVAGILSRSDGR
jgi:hypothetical protein